MDVSGTSVNSQKGLQRERLGLEHASSVLFVFRQVESRQASVGVSRVLTNMRTFPLCRFRGCPGPPIVMDDGVHPSTRTSGKIDGVVDVNKGKRMVCRVRKNALKSLTCQWVRGSELERRV